MAWNVLVVDDDPACLHFVALILRLHDHTVRKFNNATSALEYITSCLAHIDLIVSDIAMPGMCGLEFLKVLKNNPRLRHIPVIFQTADSEAPKECLRLGAKGCIIKPYKSQALLKLVDNILIPNDSIREPIEPFVRYERHTARKLSA